jgi:hypothetical protein
MLNLNGYVLIFNINYLVINATWARKLTFGNFPETLNCEHGLLTTHETCVMTDTRVACISYYLFLA